MNASIANLILSRIEVADFAFLDKYAGLTRAITDGRLDKPVTIPVSCTVNDPLACDSSTLADLLPDPKYRSVLFFEGDTVPRKIVKRAIGTSYESRLRLIVWLNCEKLGGACNCGDVPLMQLIDLLNKRIPDSSPFNRIVVSVEGGGPTRGSEVFGKYTLDNKATQFLHYPFDYFALDITVSFMLIPGCSPESIAEDVACWTPPSNPRRRYPKDFTCEELTNTETGLTATQLGSDCLDCGGSGPCDPTILNGIEIVGNIGTVLQGGVQVGTVNAATGVVTVDECEDATVANSDGSYSELIPSGDGLILPDNSISLEDSLGTPISTTLVPATSPATITAPNGTAQPKDSSGTNIGSAISAPSGGATVTATIADSAIQNKDSAGTNIGSVVNVKATQPATITTADSTITLPNGTTTGLKATQPFDVRPYAPMKFVLSIYHAFSAVFTITADEAGSYTAWTDDGASGTWTYSKNGGAFIAATGTVVLAIGDTIQVQRTITTAQGIRRWAH